MFQRNRSRTAERGACCERGGSIAVMICGLTSLSSLSAVIGPTGTVTLRCRERSALWTHYAILAALSMPLGSLVTFRTPNSEIRGFAHRLELIQVRTVGFARRFGESGPDMRLD